MLETINNFQKVQSFINSDSSNTLFISYGQERRANQSLKEKLPLAEITNYMEEITESPFVLNDLEVSFFENYLPSFAALANELSLLTQIDEFECADSDLNSLMQCSDRQRMLIEASAINNEKAITILETNLYSLHLLDLHKIMNDLKRQYELLIEEFSHCTYKRLEDNYMRESDFESSIHRLCPLLFQMKRGVQVCSHENAGKLYNRILLFLFSFNNYQRAKRIQKQSIAILAMSDAGRRDKLIALKQEFVNRKNGAFAIEEMIVFEIFADFRLRNSHFDDLFFLSSVPILQEHFKEQSNPLKSNNKILSKAMGGGKSLVISTLLVKMLAKDGKVPILVFLSSLINSSGKDLLNRNASWFGQRGHLLYCDRALSQSEAHMNNLLKLVQSCKFTGEYLITTPEYLQSIINGSNEALLSKTSLSAIYRSLFNLLSLDSIIIFDEIDEQAKPFSELNFVTGKELSLSNDLYKASFSLFLTALSDESIRSVINLEDFETSVDSYEEFKRKLSVPFIIEMQPNDQELFSYIINVVLPNSLADVYQENYGLPGSIRPVYSYCSSL